MSALPENCEPCRSGDAALSEAEAAAFGADIPRWTLEFPVLRRSFALADFRRALAFINRVGMLAEEEDHHPDIHLTSYRNVEFSLTTHAVDGLSQNDFILARKIDALAEKDGLG